MRFRLDMIPPTVTAQEHRVRVVNGKPMFYDSAALKAARATFESRLLEHAPPCPMEGPLALVVCWRFPTRSHPEHTWRSTRPDTDNLQKLLKDCMTRTGFWKDDAQVALELVSKQWTRNHPGIDIEINSLKGRC